MYVSYRNLVTTFTSERPFTSLKTIKTYLRSIILGDNQLNALALFNIHSKIIIKYKQVVLYVCIYMYTCTYVYWLKIMTLF